jgi:hypothetical protein
MIARASRAALLAGLAFSVTLAGSRVARADDPPAPTSATFQSGSTLTYGVTLSLVQFSTVRSPNEPGRFRNYAPDLQVLPTEIGFQFVYNPQFTPWRLTKQDGKPFQLFSVGGSLLARIKSQSLEQGNISLAIQMGFFDNAISLGVGIDLYRGIPVLSGTGVPGGATAYTGLLSWAFAKEGGVTPENVFVVLSFSLTKIVSAISGEVR